MKLPTLRLTVVLLLLPWSPPGLASPQPLEKFPHPYVAHPSPHQEEVQVHLPDHHPEELKLPRKCRTDYVSVVSKECHTVYEKECSTTTKHKYKTEYVEECQDLKHKQCRPSTREIEDQDCKPIYEEKCTKETQHSYDVDYESKCHPVRKRICHATVPYGYLRGRLRREASPSPSHHGYGEVTGQCEVITKEVCEQVAVKVAKYVEVPVCLAVPHYTCQTVTREVPSTECVEETYQKCHKAPSQIVLDVPIETCQEVPLEICQDVNKQVPTTTCRDYKH